MTLPDPPRRSSSRLFALVLTDDAGHPEEVVAVFHLVREAEAFTTRLDARGYRVVPLRFVADFM